MTRHALHCLLVALLATMTSCGGGNGDDPEESAPTAREEFDQRVTSAGRDLKKLMEVNDWVWSRMTSGDPDAGEWAPLKSTIEGKVQKTFSDLIKSLARGGRTDALKQLDEWVTTIRGRHGEEGEEWVTPEFLESVLPPGSRSPATVAETAGLLNMMDPLFSYLDPLRDELYRAILEVEPQRGDLREKLGWFQPDDLGKSLKQDWMDDDDVAGGIETIVARIERDAKPDADGNAWLPPDWRHKNEYADLKKRLAEMQTAHTEKMADPFTAGADRMFRAITKDLAKGLNTAYRWTYKIHKPYLIIVEQDKSWIEEDVAEEKATALLELMRTFYEEYGDPLSLVKIDKPVPVILFRKQTAYYEYVKANSMWTPGIQAHYEPGTGRLFVSDTITNSTLMHEGTHQIVHFNQKWIPPLRRSYWFSEGVAEYFSGSHRYIDPETKKWHYDIGRLQQKRLDYWRQNEHKALKVWDMLNMTKADEQKNKAEDDIDLNLFVYSQGWFVIYFLNNFNVSEDGVVGIGKPGKYREEWIKFLGAELGGRTGRKVFLECMGLLGSDGEVDEAKWKVFHKELMDYYEWMNRKTSLGYHVKDGELVPWNKVKNRRGRLIGERGDDMLHPPADDG